MVDDTPPRSSKVTPHEYFDTLRGGGGSVDLFREIRRVDDRCHQAGVHPIYTLTHLSIIAHIAHNRSRDVIVNNSSYYTLRKLAKKSNRKVRIIHSPKPPLKSIQRAILVNCLPKYRASNISYAFENDLCTVDAAEQHIGAHCMIHIDIKDFLHSIGSKRAYKVFDSFGYPKLLSLEMALISTVGHKVEPKLDREGFTYKIFKGGYLPQGSPASGKIANFICQDLDKDLQAIARKWAGVVTRYADDISFSLPFPIDRKACLSIISDLRSAVNSSGFTVNEKKTRFFPSANNFKMLGLIVDNLEVRLDSHYKATVRSHLYGISKFGLESHGISRGFSSEFDLINFLWGHYAYAKRADPTFASEIESKLHSAGVPRI